MSFKISMVESVDYFVQIESVDYFVQIESVDYFGQLSVNGTRQVHF